VSSISAIFLASTSYQTKHHACKKVTLV